jgi:two-component system, OmpR family, sensor histidine kinase KdpD
MFGLAAVSLLERRPDGLLAEASAAVDRVSRVVDNLRDLSRLHAGAVETYLRPVDLDVTLTASLGDLGPGRQEVTLSMGEDLSSEVSGRR